MRRSPHLLVSGLCPAAVSHRRRSLGRAVRFQRAFFCSVQAGRTVTVASLCLCACACVCVNRPLTVVFLRFRSISISFPVVFILTVHGHVGTDGATLPVEEPLLDRALTATGRRCGHAAASRLSHPQQNHQPQQPSAAGGRHENGSIRKYLNRPPAGFTVLRRFGDGLTDCGENCWDFAGKLQR